MKIAVRLLAFLSLFGLVLFGSVQHSAQAKEGNKKISHYQVLTQDEDGTQTAVSFNNKIAFDQYVKQHPVKPKHKFFPADRIYSTLYENINGGGWSIQAYANVMTNLAGNANDAVSSVRTHPHGNYTYVYIDANGGGNALALANTGGLYNLLGPVGDGSRTWNDEVSSVLVRSN
ncbi:MULTISPECIES: hypothetical protein [Bacillus]|uniref:hypothetical protein n=1 Tax=Bacillus TaxID=1386 RepID=UPI0003F4BBBB|nr:MULTISPECIES: hypothetical protein [Bacillus]QHZ45581.1 hypothetical protein M654_004295 [Bacillus sp. NSP9.1]WFA04614.1 hypothetical protein P3X63_18750 [Bacillus sp. HSf4]